MSVTHDATTTAPFGNATRTRISNAERTERDAGRRRSESVKGARELASWHEDTLRSLLTHKSDDKTKLGLPALLTQLTDVHGLGWSEVARLVGVSVPAVRKWRHGGDINPVRLHALAHLAAFLDMLLEEEVQDPAAWLNVPFDVGGDLAISKREIYIAGGAVDLLLLVKGYIDHDELMARRSPIDGPGRRQSAVVLMPDGNLSVGPGKRER